MDGFTKQVPALAEIILADFTGITFTTSNIGIDDNSVTNFDIGYSNTQRSNLASTIRSGDVGQFQLQTSPPITDKYIHPVQSRSL
jgi:hypothetical protein